MDLLPEELDDDEFQLPTVTNLPTLESILNEDDPGSISDSELNLNSAPNLLDSNLDHGDTASIHSRNSDSRPRNVTEKGHSVRKTVRKAHGTVLRHVVLKGVTSQLMSANDRVGAGLPTCMDVGMYICIGTSHGFILVFEHSQVLKWYLGSAEIGDLHGGVSCLAINQDGSKLLAGFSKGHVQLYDLTNGKLLQNICDAQTPYTAVLHIKWTDSPGLAVLSDSGGNVFEVSIKRLIGLNSNESKCIFSGSRGEVCTIQPLNMGQYLSLPPVDDTVIVAMGTLSKVIVMALRPHLKVYFSKALPSSLKTLPLLSWQFVVIQLPDGSKVIDPVLAFGRDFTLYFYQLTHGSQEEMAFIFLQEIELPYTLQAIAWLNSRCLAIMDTLEKLHVIDVKTQQELDRVDLARLGLVYATAHFKGLATGGNVSKAMANCGERACYHSMKTLGTQVLLLGTKSFQVVTIRNWSDRLDYIVKNGNMTDALHLAIDIYEQKAQGIVGLPQSKEKRKKLVRNKVFDLLTSFITTMQNERPLSDGEEKLIHYDNQNIPVAVRVCIITGYKNVLFTSLWESVSNDEISRGIFLEALEPHILDNNLKTIPPQISQHLLTHYESRDKLEAIEACIVHMEITSLDLHQAVTMCWKHSLFDAILYISTRGMNDYISPLEELMKKLQSVVSQDELLDENVSLGNRILVYISCCLAGRAYPHGNIDEGDVKQVKHDVFTFISSIHSKNREDEEPYPYLRTLLRFDTKEFLNVLSLAFQEEEFTSELGLVQRQRIVDILLEIMTGSCVFTSSQLGSLFTFIARQISKQDGPVLFTKGIFDQVIIHLTDVTDKSHHEERESALLELLSQNKLGNINHNELLERASNAHFYRVCEHLYELRGDYDHILYCYVKDPLRKYQSFNYVRKFLSSSKYSEKSKSKVIEQVRRLIIDLIKVDSAEVAELLLTTKNLFKLISLIASDLQSNISECYEFLAAIFSFSKTSVSNGKNKENNVDIEAILYPELQEKFIDLMAELSPEKVPSYLKEVNGYRLEEILKICEKRNVIEGKAYIMERRGNFYEAFKIYMSILEKKINKLKNSIEYEDVTKISVYVGQICLQTTKLINVCELGSQNMDENSRESLWFPLLEELLTLQPLLASYTDKETELRNLIGCVVNSMMPHISLSKTLEKVMQNANYNDCNFGQIRHLLNHMVDIYFYEKVFYSATVKAIRKEHLGYISLMKQHASSHLPINSPVCCACESAPDRMVTFPCGHVFHVTCSDQKSCSICNSSEEMTLNESHRDGLKKMQVLNSSIGRILKSFNDDEIDQNFSSYFALKLAPQGHVSSNEEF